MRWNRADLAMNVFTLLQYWWGTSPYQIYCTTKSWMLILQRKSRPNKRKTTTIWIVMKRQKKIEKSDERMMAKRIVRCIQRRGGIKRKANFPQLSFFTVWLWVCQNLHRNLWIVSLRKMYKTRVIRFFFLILILKRFYFSLISSFFFPFLGSWRLFTFSIVIIIPQSVFQW